MQFDWSCTTAGQACRLVSGALLVLPRLNNVSVGAGQLASGGVYSFQLRVSKDVRVGTATTAITVQDGDVPQVSISATSPVLLSSTGVLKINTGGRFIVQASSAALNVSSLSGNGTAGAGIGPSVKYAWSLVGVDVTNPALVAISPLGDTLAVSDSALTPGQTIVAGVAVTNAANATGATKMTVVVNTPPSGGVCSLTPTRGRALSTTFDVLCERWADEDLPISYQIGYYPQGQNESSSAAVALEGSRAPEQTFVLGSGNWTVVVRVLDGLGGASVPQLLPVQVDAASSSALSGALDASAASNLLGRSSDVTRCVDGTVEGGCGRGG